jgi:hypothetical protein
VRKRHGQPSKNGSLLLGLFPEQGAAETAAILESKFPVYSSLNKPGKQSLSLKLLEKARHKAAKLAKKDHLSALQDKALRHLIHSLNRLQADREVDPTVIGINPKDVSRERKSKQKGKEVQ